MGEDFFADGGDCGGMRLLCALRAARRAVLGNVGLHGRFEVRGVRLNRSTNRIAFPNHVRHRGVGLDVAEQLFDPRVVDLDVARVFLSGEISAVVALLVASLDMSSRGSERSIFYELLLVIVGLMMTVQMMMRLMMTVLVVVMVLLLLLALSLHMMALVHLGRIVGLDHRSLLKKLVLDAFFLFEFLDDAIDPFNRLFELRDSGLENMMVSQRVSGGFHRSLRGVAEVVDRHRRDVEPVEALSRGNRHWWRDKGQVHAVVRVWTWPVGEVLGRWKLEVGQLLRRHLRKRHQ